MGFWSSFKKPQTENTLEHSAGDTQVLRKRLKSPSSRVVLQPRTNGPPDSRLSTFPDAQSEHFDIGFRSQGQSAGNNVNSVKPASNVPRDGLWSWIPHVTQSADDSTIVDRVKDVFFYAEHIADSFYASHGDNRSVPDTDLAKINHSCLLSTTTLRNYLEESCHQITLIKHTLISLILELISFDSTTVSKTLLPEEFKNYAAIAEAGTMSSLLGRQGQYLQPALSSYRVLIAYIYSDIENNENYLKHQNSVVDQVSSDIDRSFHYWAKAETSGEDRRAMLRRLLKKASSLGILLFAQPSVFRFDWEAMGNNQSSQTLPMWPRLLRIIDNEAQQRSVGECMISTKHGIIFEERNGLPTEAIDLQSQSSPRMRPRTSPTKPTARGTISPTWQNHNTSQSTSVPPLTSTEGYDQFHAHEPNDSGNLVNQTDDLDINLLGAVAPFETVGRGSLDLSRVNQRSAIRGRSVFQPQRGTSSRNDISYLDPASSHKRDVKTRSLPQYRAENLRPDSYRDPVWQTYDQGPNQVSSWPRPLPPDPVTSYNDYGPIENVSTSMLPPYEAVAGAPEMNLPSQQPKRVRGADVGRSNSRRSMTISTLQPLHTSQHPHTTNDRTSLEQASSPQYTMPYLRMPEPHIGPAHDMQPHLTPNNVPWRPVPAKHGSTTSYPPIASERSLANLSLDANANYIPDAARDASRRSASRSRRRRSNSSPAEPSPSRSRSSSRHSFHGYG